MKMKTNNIQPVKLKPEETIRKIFRSYRKIESDYLLLSSIENIDDVKFIKKLKQQRGIIFSWFQLLDDNERFIVEKHLIAGLPWSMVQIEFENRWGIMQSRHERTLKRMQAKAIKKIVNSDYSEILRNELFDIFGN